MRSRFRRPGGPRRGVTLVEMLVVVALVVLMMTILVQIFQSATGAMSLSRTTQELDVVLRQIDSMIRADLAGVTAKMTPPNDPTQKTGYFEYGENSFADAQGEDTDDYLAFTTKAPEGQVFTGRQYVTSVNNNIQPISVTSQVGEVIYFLRNGNLYRRVFLVAPERAKSISPPNAANGYTSSMFGSFPLYGLPGNVLPVSWQGFNEISCRPGGFSNNGASFVRQNPIPNDLGDLTNRENRAFRPRFLNDFTSPNANSPDGIADDANGDGLDDYYPTLYYNGAGHQYNDANGNPIWSPNGLTAEIRGYTGAIRVEPGTTKSFDVYPFPYIFPGSYSVADNSNPYNRIANGLGSIHYQPNKNHAPLDIATADSLPIPSVAGDNQTWWGFPTWRETMAGLIGTSTGWTDPVIFLSGNNHFQPNGLRPVPPNVAPSTIPNNLLPPLLNPNLGISPFSFDGVGSASFVAAPSASGSTVPLSPNPIWEDDLILTNVRSFDVKAYDGFAPLYNVLNNNGTAYVTGPFSAGYHDLGYGESSYVKGLSGNAGNGIQNSVPFQTVNSFNGVSNEPQGFGHEGRIPPRPEDYRYHPRYQGFNSSSQTTYGNVGDPSNSVIRLTRVWDSWSTDYTNAPDSDDFLHGYIPGLSNAQPIYPSFPPPYPSPLRGIQIQIRIVDPRNERSKVLTIRHDFTDKL